MDNILLDILDYSEVWALLIPLSVILLRKPQPIELKPVIVYVYLALAINILIDAIMAINTHNKNFALSNNPLYNLHSVVRFTCFSVFFLRLPQETYQGFRKVLVALFVFFLLFNFGLFEKFIDHGSFSGNLLTMESYILLVFCLLYYLSELKSDRNDLFHGSQFWIVTGLSAYVVTNFFVFLFYIPMLKENIKLATNIWNVHNISFIVFCLFIAKALYVPAGYKLTS